MDKIRRILFPVDLSPKCAAVIPYVQAMAAGLDAEVTALNVLEEPCGYYKDWNAYLTLVNWEAIREDRERRLASFFEREYRKPVLFLMQEGDPALKIIHYAQENAIDLIMMPTHGYGAFRTLLIGSVAAKVLHDVEIPVWTSVHSPDPAPHHGACRRVLCAVDVTEKDIPTMCWAAGFARRFKASLHLVHAIPGAESADASFHAFLIDSARTKLAKLQQSAGVNVESCVAAGSVGDVIHEAAIRHKADLVVAGRGHASETLGRLRTNVYTIIRQSPCPVISI